MEKVAMSHSENPSPDFWRGRRVLLTGHTGFKGAWLAFWLHRLGAQVTGMSLPSQTSPNLFTLADIGTITDSHFIDIRDAGSVATAIKQAQPEIVFHLAAQALVRTSYRDPLETFATNVLGTANVLDALRPLGCTIEDLGTPGWSILTPTAKRMHWEDMTPTAPAKPRQK